jgi:hypothetical protein
MDGKERFMMRRFPIVQIEHRWFHVLPNGRLLPVIGGAANGGTDEWLNCVDGNPTHSQPVFGTDNFKFHCIDEADHTVNLATDVDEADVTAAAEVATSANLTGVTHVTTTGVLSIDFTDEVLSTVSGDQFESIYTYKDSGVATTSPLLFNHDTGTGLPFTPSGGDITVAPHSSGWVTVDRLG